MDQVHTQQQVNENATFHVQECKQVMRDHTSDILTTHNGSYKLWLWCNWSNEEQVWCQVCASEYFCERDARRREATFIEMFGKRPIISVNSALSTSFEVSDEPMQFVHILKSLESWVSVGCTLH